MVKGRIAEIIERALDRAAQDGLLPKEGRPAVQLDAPKNAAHGDFACNAAMVLQKQHAAAAGLQKPNPRALAQAIVERIEDPEKLLSKVDIAGPGFLNLTLAHDVWHKAARAIEDQRGDFGRSDAGKQQKTMVEFVSANPTGPMHVGHGRGAVIGDTVASLLDWAGWDVSREFYINDAGGQVWRLAHAVWVRAAELFPGRVPEYRLQPDDYQGDYIKDVARAWVATLSDPVTVLSDSKSEFENEQVRKFATDWILNHFIKPDLSSFGIRFDTFYSEKTLHDRDAIGSVVRWLTEHELAKPMKLEPPKGQERDPHDDVDPDQEVLVFLTEQFGDDQNRPIYKRDGSPTYFAADIAYHKDKLDRGFGRLINVWGADHGGYVARMKAAVKAMGGELEVILFQLVNLLKDGQPFKMSKRAANYVTLRELLEEAGADATRFFFLLRRGDMALDFDVALAKKHSNDNPVYYVQYGHARCAAILRKAGIDKPEYRLEDVGALQLPEEIELIKRLLNFPELVASAAQSLEPHRIVFYLQETIAQFHSYYTKYKKTERVISDDKQKTAARLWLTWAVKQTLANALALLGVSAPDKMEAPEEGDAVE